MWLYLVVTWLAAGAFLVLQPITHIPTEVLTITQFAPTVAVLVVAATRRGAALRAWQGPPGATLRRIAVAAAVLAAVGGLAVIILAATGTPIHVTAPGTLAEPLWLIAITQLIGACGEEFGWRSFLQPHLERRYSPVISALIVGLMWGTWHVEYFTYGLPFIAGFLVLTVAVSVIMARLVRGVSSLAVAGTFHWLLNLLILLALTIDDHHPATLVTLDAVLMLAAVAVWSLPSPSHETTQPEPHPSQTTNARHP